MDRESFIEDNKRQYKDVYSRMNWISETRARQAEVEREALLKDLASAGALFGYNDTKTDCRDLPAEKAKRLINKIPGGDGIWDCERIPSGLLEYF